MYFRTVPSVSTTKFAASAAWILSPRMLSERSTKNVTVSRSGWLGNWTIKIVRRLEAIGELQLLKRSWVAGRTLPCLNHQR
jgi:hypothetical protein